MKHTRTAIRTKFVAAALIILSLTGFSCPSFAQDSQMQQLSDKVYDFSINCWWRSFIVSKLMDFKLSPAIWTRMLDDSDWGVKTTNNVALYLGDYGKKHGMGDLEAAESSNNNDRTANKPQVESMVDAMRGKVSFTLQADTVKGTPSEWDLIHRYMNTVGEIMAGDDFNPKGGAALVTLVASPTAKDISVVANPDGKHFTVTAPTLVEPSEWDSKIRRGLERAH